jgi:DNA-binding IscR family transcriptional regulator
MPLINQIISALNTILNFIRVPARHQITFLSSAETQAQIHWNEIKPDLINALESAELQDAVKEVTSTKPRQ